MVRARTMLALSVLALACASNAGAQARWSRFRGPGGRGIAPDDKPLPVEFGAQHNLLWACPVSSGHSSPCVWDDRIFLTGCEGEKLETLCIDRASGAVLWRKSVQAEAIERHHRINSPASPTPTADGERVFVYFGSFGLLCYDFEGEEQWRRPLAAPDNSFGTAASPIVAGDYLILNRDSNEGSYLEAIDRETGESVWRKEREGFKSGWSTPVLWRRDGSTSCWCTACGG